MKRRPKSTPATFVWREPEVPVKVRWSLLDRKGHLIIRGVLAEWQRLLRRDGARAEAACHRFLGENAGIFLRRLQNYPVAVSKLRLGAEHVTDLVVVENCYSHGAKYHLYELESPADPLFTKKGTASQELLAAIHQVISWKSWIAEHAAEARRLFPSLMHSYNLDALFSYTIVIGRRVTDADTLKRRRELAASLGIEIRSFDSMTDGIQHRFYHDTPYPMSGDVSSRLSPEERSELLNPFHRAMTDPEWRELVRGVWDLGHFYRVAGAKYCQLAKSSKHLADFRRWTKKYGERPSGSRVNPLLHPQAKSRRKPNR